jgi:tetratricopeptide (TPR) repeat protein
MKRLPRSTDLCLLATATTIFIAASITAQTNAMADNKPAMTTEKWQADIKYLGNELAKRHRNAFHRMDRQQYETAVKNLYDGAPSMTEDEIIVGMMKIVAMIKDGHTTITPRGWFRSGIFPVKLYFFSDGLFVQKAAPEYADIVGARVVKIGKVTADEAVRLATPAAFADNEMGAKSLLPTLFCIPEVLAGLKINNDKTKLSLTVESAGRQRTVEIKPASSFESLLQQNAFAGFVDAVGNNAVPLYLKHPNDLYWFEYLKDQRLLYVQHNGIANKDDEPVADFYKRVFAFVDANPVDKFVLDLRFNGGGNNILNRPVVIDLIRSKINQRGKFFVIIGRQTFSAAQNFVNQIEKYTEAVFVGEPTAAHPNHYGDSRPFTLPNSQLQVRASTLWWQDLDPRDERFWTAPEIAAEVSSDDYRNGRDPAIEAVLEYIPGSALSELIARATRQPDLSEFVPKYKAFRASSKSKFVSSEAPMNSFGYALLERKRIADAITVFQLNVEAYPRSANVYDSLGDAYQAAGRKDDAIKAYEKALSIDPNFASSLENLRRLKGQ